VSDCAQIERSLLFWHVANLRKTAEAVDSRNTILTIGTYELCPENVKIELLQSRQLLDPGQPFACYRWQDSSVQQSARRWGDHTFLDTVYKGQVNGEIQDAYTIRLLYEQLGDPKYTEKGGNFDIIAFTVIQKDLELANAG
jgi:hypothetical protein